jgi:hypothetical protein
MAIETTFLYLRLSSATLEGLHGTSALEKSSGTTRWFNEAGAAMTFFNMHDASTERVIALFSLSLFLIFSLISFCPSRHPPKRGRRRSDGAGEKGVVASGAKVHSW